MIPSYRNEGLVYLVSNNKNAARDLRGKLVGKLEEKAEQFHGAGIEEIRTYCGEDFTVRMIDHPNAEINIELGAADDFEQEILDVLKPLSEAFVSNVTIKFEDYSPEPEFDILWVLVPNH